MDTSVKFRDFCPEVGDNVRIAFVLPFGGHAVILETRIKSRIFFFGAETKDGIKESDFVYFGICSGRLDYGDIAKRMRIDYIHVHYFNNSHVWYVCLFENDRCFGTIGADVEIISRKNKEE